MDVLTQEIYLNQAQVADLGSEALAALPTLLRSTGLGAAMGPLQLLQPSLWLSSGRACRMDVLRQQDIKNIQKIQINVFSKPPLGKILLGSLMSKH